MILFNTLDWDQYLNDSETYAQFCDNYGDENTIPAKDSHIFFEYCIQLANWDYEDFCENLRGSDIDCGKWIVSGRLGLWNGNPAVYGVFDSLTAAVEACSYGMNDISAEYDSDASEIDFTGYHHDGRNYFTIRKLSALGADAADDMETFSFDDPANFAKLPEYLY